VKRIRENRMVTIIVNFDGVNLGPEASKGGGDTVPLGSSY